MNFLITLSGVDERTDVAELAKLDCEIGFLYSKTNKGNRYPRIEWIREASSFLRWNSLHVCGIEARNSVLDWRYFPFKTPDFQRMQINGIISKNDTEFICHVYSHYKIITQHTEKNLENLEIKHRNHYILVDDSGGKGVSPEKWIKPCADKFAGYAGGLGPDNIEEELKKIYTVAGENFWIDMESKLRVDDWFSIEKAKEVIEKANSTKL